MISTDGSMHNKRFIILNGLLLLHVAIYVDSYHYDNVFVSKKKNTQYMNIISVKIYCFIGFSQHFVDKSPLPPFEHIQIKFSDFMHHILIKQPNFTIEQSNFLYIIEI